jgi:serine/threonine protein kinase
MTGTSNIANESRCIVPPDQTPLVLRISKFPVKIIFTDHNKRRYLKYISDDYDSHVNGVLGIKKELLLLFQEYDTQIKLSQVDRLVPSIYSIFFLSISALDPFIRTSTGKYFVKSMIPADSDIYYLCCVMEKGLQVDTPRLNSIENLEKIEEGIKRLSANGFLQLDIKPQNLVFALDGQILFIDLNVFYFKKYIEIAYFYFVTNKKQLVVCLMEYIFNLYTIFNFPNLSKPITPTILSLIFISD